ncbi:acyl-CoA N-acyltransferase [Roridomyces roridus]|uniref:Acyl-CoA N-acyltransferase n=1 Tax=Roridomyces roridus TaxID=1738132 RepID=A0AAD7B8J3_9AGAR|nr:acyl-CoA N-acyltransferase [Roridomyces roridus]
MGCQAKDTNPPPNQTSYYIRPHRPTDSPQIRALFLEAFATGEGSVASVGRRRFLTQPASLIVYLLGGVGLGVVVVSGPSTRRWTGALVCTAGIALFAGVRYYIAQEMLAFCDGVMRGDLGDIGEYYKAPAMFWVAVQPKENDEEEVIGGVGLGESSLASIRPGLDMSQQIIRPRRTRTRHTAHVRRMIVSPKHRRRGIAARLMHALIDNAESIPTLRGLDLETSDLQPGARRMYEGLGWRVFAEERAGNFLGTVVIRQFRRTVGGR